MKLCITEKPSVAADIARLLGADARRQGFYEGAGYCVTWTFGHLCCLKEPHDYSDLWKRWSLGQLPMLPPRFGIKLIDDEGIKRQFKVIETLAAKADVIINCGDAGQEGELIQRWVMQKAEVKCPVKRLWISSMTDQAIREGFASLQDQQAFDNLYYAGLSRAVGDWILGMNATRLYTLKYSQGHNVLSIGRVQTPTLAMIVKRHYEIENFVPKDTYEVHTVYRDVDFTSNAKFDSPDDAAALVDRLAPLPLRVDNVTSRQVREAPPRLFDLTSLQVECNRRWGWTADDSLRLIQTLYEKKVTTYPRVDTTYLPDDVYPKVPEILRRMTPYADKTAPILAARITKSKKVFDNSKVTDHHAIIPTGESPERLVGDEKLLYHLIATRFIAAFYPDCLARQTSVEATVGDTPFKVTGKVITDPGWRVLYPSKSDRDADDDTPRLPPMTVGESGPHTPSVVKKTSQPPKLYTEGTLLRAMETAGRSIDDETLREAMKENGIGRPSTRAAIIETLFRRRYIARQRKSIVPTPAGIELINTINEDLIKSPRLTGIWENKLRRIARGEYSAAEFIAELKEMIAVIVRDVLSDNSSRRIVTDDVAGATVKASKTSARPARPRAKRSPSPKSLDDIKCPVCGEGHLIKGRTAYGCSRYASGCSFLLPFTDCPADATPAKVGVAARKKSKAR